MRRLFQTDKDTKTLVKTLYAEVQELNARMRHDQTEIERLKCETRVIAQRTDAMLLQIEAELDVLEHDTLRKAAS